MLPLGLLVTQTGHSPVSGMTDITSIVWPGHFRAAALLSGHRTRSRLRRELVAEVVSDAGDVGANNDGGAKR